VFDRVMMTMTIRQLCSVVACTLTVAATAATTGPASKKGDQPLEIDRLVNPKVGQWVLYDMRDAATGKQLTVRQSIVGKKTVDGRDAYWIETDVMSREGSRVIRKMLITDEPAESRKILEIIEKTGAEPARVVPVPKPDPTEHNRTKPDVTVEEIGPETVITQAGSIEARHFRVKSSEGSHDVWTSDKVGLSGTVRRVSAAGEMVLVAYAPTGAASAIIEEPTEPAVQPSVREPASPGPAKENEQ